MGIDCLLIVPGIRATPYRERFTTIYDFPRGALSLGTFIKEKGCSVRILPLDYYLAPSSDPLEIEGQIQGIVEAAIREWRPSLIGISVPYTMLYPISIKTAEYCKEVDPEVVVALGGPHVSYMDTQCLEDCPAVDVVVRGEGEWTLLELIGCIREGRGFSGVRGITYREGDRTISNPPRPLGDIEELPVLDYGLLPENFVRNMAVSIVASRGCAYRCAYCNESRFWGPRVRRLSVEKIVEEMRQLAEGYDNYPVGLEDSMFDMRTSYFYRLCDALSRIRLNPNIYLLSRVDAITEEGCETMVRAGIRNLILGIESASPRVLRVMNKRIDMEMAERACRMATEKGIIVGTFWIIGHPGDSPEEAEITIETIDRFYREGIIHSSEIALFVPYPGTAIFENPEAFGVEILTYDWEKWGRFNTEPVFQLKGFPREEILKAWRRAKAVDERWRRLRLYASMMGGAKTAPSIKVGRNDPCPCGSGKKYKKCCGR